LSHGQFSNIWSLHKIRLQQGVKWAEVLPPGPVPEHYGQASIRCQEEASEECPDPILTLFSGVTIIRHIRDTGLLARL